PRLCRNAQTFRPRRQNRRGTSRRARSARLASSRRRNSRSWPAPRRRICKRKIRPRAFPQGREHCRKDTPGRACTESSRLSLAGLRGWFARRPHSPRSAVRPFLRGMLDAGERSRVFARAGVSPLNCVTLTAVAFSIFRFLISDFLEIEFQCALFLVCLGFVPLLAFAQQSSQVKPRARDLGVPFDGAPGTFNAITDVPGVLV